MSRCYAIADLHLGHKNILKFRPSFKSVEFHDKYIVNRILETCGKRDSLYLLGDCFFSVESLDHLREMKSKIGSIHMVLGNHDTENKLRLSIIMTALNEGLIDSIHGLLKYKGIWLSHAPIHETELRGKYCVHGHTHSVVVDDNRYLGVSCEQVAYKPINFQAIKEIFEEWKELS